MINRLEKISLAEDMDHLNHILLQFSQMVPEHPAGQLHDPSSSLHDPPCMHGLVLQNSKNLQH